MSATIKNSVYQGTTCVFKVHNQCGNVLMFTL